MRQNVNNYKSKLLSISEMVIVASNNDFRKIFLELLLLFEIPRPSKNLEKHFSHPSIIRYLLINSMSNEYLSQDEIRVIRPELTKAIKKLNVYSGDYFIRYRILAPDGVYPNHEIDRANCHYLIQNQLPVIWTKNKITMDMPILDMSVTNWLTRNELKLATSIMCSSGGNNFHMCFTGHNMIELDWLCIKSIPDELKSIFLKEYFELTLRFTPIGVKAWQRKPLYDPTQYEFNGFENQHKSFKKIFDNFSIQNDLLLRTCNYFLKSRMHWENTINAEEAIACVFFCIEGCLHLIQKKYGDQQTKLNLTLLKEVFTRDIKNGDNIFSIIKDGYKTRITLVHPEPAWGSEWRPNINADDFFEYYRISHGLLNFILADKYDES